MVPQCVWQRSVRCPRRGSVEAKHVQKVVVIDGGMLACYCWVLWDLLGTGIIRSGKQKSVERVFLGKSLGRQGVWEPLPPTHLDVNANWSLYLPRSFRTSLAI